MEPTDYHALPSLSSSKIRDFLTEGPRMYEARHIKRIVQVKETADMRTGTAVHALLAGLDSVVKIPEEVLSKSGSRAGAAWKQFEQENAGKTLVKPDEWGDLHRIVSAVRNHPLAGNLYAADGEAEKVIAWNDADTGLPCRAMLDWTCKFKNRNWIADLKVSSARSPREWRARAEDAFYHAQQEWYRWGYRENFDIMPLFVFVVVANEPPHVCRVYLFGADEEIAARAQIRGAIDEIDRRTQVNDWSDEGENEVTVVSLSKWALEVKYGKRNDDNDNDYASDGAGGEERGDAEERPRISDERDGEAANGSGAAEAHDSRPAATSGSHGSHAHAEAR